MQSGFKGITVGEHHQIELSLSMHHVILLDVWFCPPCRPTPAPFMDLLDQPLSTFLTRKFQPARPMPSCCVHPFVRLSVCITNK